MAQQLPVPDELVIEILPWLPVRSILRFTCLSKYFYSVIESRAFINSQQARSSQSFNHRKMIFLGGETMAEAKVCDMNFDDEGDKEILRLKKPVSCSSSREVYGYCKGLLLLNQKPLCSILSQRVLFGLWNPSTGQYEGIPAGCLEFGEPYSIIASGLGFDDSSGGYKAYKVVLKVALERENGVEVHVWIYELE